MADQERVSQQAKKLNQEAVDLDDLLPEVGEFGRYQKLLIWLVCLPACIPCGFSAFNQLFMADPVAHWCRVPQLDHLTPQLRRHLAIPLKVGTNDSWEECSRYSIDWSEVGVVDQPNTSWPLEPCWDGWEFDIAQGSSSIVIDFELVCSKDIYPTIGLAGLNLGGPIGVYLFGTINDRIGRRLSFFLCLFILIGGNVLSALAPDFWSWVVARFIAGLTIPAVYQIPFIISLELVGPNYRSFVTVLTCLSYTLGLVLLSLVSYLIRDWRLLAYITSLPFLLYYIYWWFLPESPRWLLAKGRLAEALAILETLARINGNPLPESFKHKLKSRMMLQRSLSEERKLQKGPGVSSLCKTPNMRLKTTLITLNCLGPVNALGNSFMLAGGRSTSLCPLPAKERHLYSGTRHVSPGLLPKSAKQNLVVVPQTCHYLSYPEDTYTLPTSLRGVALSILGYHIIHITPLEVSPGLLPKSAKQNLVVVPQTCLYLSYPEDTYTLPTSLRGVALSILGYHIIHITPLEGLSYYGPALGDDQYLSFLLSCLVEVPSYLMCWLLMDRCGRRWPLSLTMCLSGITSLLTVLLPQEAVTLTLVLYLISKASISASFLIIYPFAGELYPTEVRGLGIGLSAYIAGLGLIIIPFINYLGRELLALPLAILGVISILGGLSSLRLPETLHSSLPQTVEEGEEFGKEWNIQECFQCVPQPRVSRSSSYEDLDNVEMDTVTELPNLPTAKPRLVRQASILETPLDSSGSMKITYWF